MQDHPDHPREDALDEALRRLYSDQPSADFDFGWRAAVRREECIQMTEKPRKLNRFLRMAAPVCAALFLVVGTLWTGATFDPTATPTPTPSTASKGVAQFSSRAAVGNDTTMMYAEDSMVSTSADSGALWVGSADMSADDTRKLVRTVSLSLRTQSFDGDLEALNRLVAAVGGYVESRNQSGDVQSGQNRYAYLNLRIPTESLDSFLGDASAIGRVTSRYDSITDMTVQYTDNEARLQVLRAKQARLNELMAQAVNVSDLIEIESALADVQYQIESYETSQRSIDRDVNMSSVNIDLSEEKASDAAAAEDITLGERLRAAAEASVKWLGDFARNLLVFLVLIAPVAVPVIVIGVVAFLVIRRKRAKKKD